jgi:SAM-dependent methyltransferase
VAIEQALPTDEAYKSSGYYALFVERHELAQQIISGRRVLDTCCGTGWGTYHFFTPEAIAVCGIDRSYEALRHYGFHESGLSLAQMDALQLACPDDSFDVVLALESIEHFTVENGKRYVAELCRVMRPGGVLFGTTPLCADVSLIPVFQAWNQFHPYIYTRETLYGLLEQFFIEIDIYELYNETCPYFAFIAVKSGAVPLDTANLRQELARPQPDLRRLKALHYLRWSQALARLDDRKNARRLVTRAVLKTPRTLSLLKAVVVLWLPVGLTNSLRTLKHRLGPG